MRKKISAIFLATAAALCLFGGLTGCGESAPQGPSGETGHTHSFTEYVPNNDATCTEDGTETAHCDYAGCAETDTRTDKGSKLGHGEMNYHAESAATCTAGGTVAYWECPRCRKRFADDEGKTEITEFQSGALGHSYTVENKCERCGAALEYTQGLKYTIGKTGSSYSVEGDASMSGEIVIPYGYDGKPVTEIAEYAFRSCGGITSVSIPDSVTVIGSNAFWGCSGMKNINIPDSVTSIRNHAFSECSSLTSIEIPDSVTELGDGAFYCCGGLTSIVVPDSVTEIEDYTFNGCRGLKSITIPGSVTKIGSSFLLCGALTDIQFTGTVAEWKAMKKGANWDYGTPDYTVTCTDGTVTKGGTVTYFE